MMTGKMPISGLYAIADPAFARGRTPGKLAGDYLEGGAGVIQLRMKSQIQISKSKTNPKSQIQKIAEEIMGFKKSHDFTFIINDYVDIALEAGADGVHVGADDMPVSRVREMVGSKRLIGYSSHSLEETLEAEKAGADYVAFGAIFPSKTKGPGHPVQGVAKLRGVVRALKVPVVAIGGINRENFQQVHETGVAAIAMISSLTEAKDIQKEVRFFVNALSTKY